VAEIFEDWQKYIEKPFKHSIIYTRAPGTIRFYGTNFTILTEMMTQIKPVNVAGYEWIKTAFSFQINTQRNEKVFFPAHLKWHTTYHKDKDKGWFANTNSKIAEASTTMGLWTGYGITNKQVCEADAAAVDAGVWTSGTNTGFTAEGGDYHMTHLGNFGSQGTSRHDIKGHADLSPGKTYTLVINIDNAIGYVEGKGPSFWAIVGDTKESSNEITSLDDFNFDVRGPTQGLNGLQKIGGSVPNRCIYDSAGYSVGVNGEIGDYYPAPRNYVIK
tara:strand:+ start:1489 stop:2307 length:819 start_codon:yes stop_codon:yes gene_type:complete